MFQQQAAVRSSFTPASNRRWYRPRRCAVTCCTSVSSSASKGKCWLVGAGPGSIDYLTVKAERLLRTADVLVYDDLVNEEVLSCAAQAEKVYVGKRGGQPSAGQGDINKLLLHFCGQGKKVVRLKGGCPSVFSRVHSEISALAAAGISYELVPGISSALSAPLLAGFPLTHVTDGTAFAVLTGHDLDLHDWAALVNIPTLVILMGGRALTDIVQRLLDNGQDPDTPVCVIRAAGTEVQDTWQATLHQIVEHVQGQKLSPCVVVIGKVAAFKPSTP